MTMKRHADKLAYFTEKARLRKPEIERKLLGIDTGSMELKLETLSAVEVFRGLVTSTYFDADLDFLARFFGIEGEVVDRLRRTGKASGFSRLRKMEDDDGVVIYMVETRVKGPDEGPLRLDTDYGSVVASNAFDYIERTHRASLRVRQVELKRRVGCMIEGLEGLEYAMDHITGPVDVEPYLEVEATHLETYLQGVVLIGATAQDFRDISARALIAQKLGK